jgi:hypothetical protein
MAGQEIIDACKTVLAVQDELLQDFRKEGKAVAEDLRKILNESKRQADLVATASSVLRPAVEAAKSNKSSAKDVLYSIGGIVILAAMLFATGYFIGDTHRSNADEIAALKQQPKK